MPERGEEAKLGDEPMILIVDTEPRGLSAMVAKLMAVEKKPQVAILTPPAPWPPAGKVILPGSMPDTYAIVDADAARMLKKQARPQPAPRVSLKKKWKAQRAKQAGEVA